MPIKWSAVAVSEAMDAVEYQVSLADQFFAEARSKAATALSIPNLPQYMEQRIRTLLSDIDRIKQVQSAIKSVRNDIPEGAIDAEKGKTQYGEQSSLV